MKPRRVTLLTVVAALVAALVPATAGTQVQPGSITEFQAGVPNPRSVTQGRDGNVWFLGDGGVGRLTTLGQRTVFPVASNDVDPRRITPGPDGNLWFTYGNSHHIGKATPSGGVTEYLDTSVYPLGIVAGSDGAMWFTDAYNTLSRITTDGTVNPVLSYGSNVAFLDPIARSSDGGIWFFTHGPGDPNVNSLRERTTDRQVHIY